MAETDFEWDSTKAKRNLAKHGVSFDEAATVFRDKLAAIFPDPDHSDDEQREIIVGNSDRNRLLVVSFTERGDRVRIISARKANKRERQDYEENPMGGWRHE
ncbi:MAG: BrnT family toxin [Planctomycetes bacterium]|nr:BrnT family toxin [Planctomycetota bacterium]